jgi:hypothetical protein
VQFKGTQRRRRRRLIREKGGKEKKLEKKREGCWFPMAARSLGRRRTAATTLQDNFFGKDG